MKVYIIKHLYDTDGGFGDAIGQEETVCILPTKEMAEAFVNRFSNNHVYDKPYMSLYQGNLEIDEIEIETETDIEKIGFKHLYYGEGFRNMFNLTDEKWKEYTDGKPIYEYEIRISWLDETVPNPYRKGEMGEYKYWEKKVTSDEPLSTSEVLKRIDFSDAPNGEHKGNAQIHSRKYDRGIKNQCYYFKNEFCVYNGKLVGYKK